MHILGLASQNLAKMQRRKANLTRKQRTKAPRRTVKGAAKMIVRMRRPRSDTARAGRRIRIRIGPQRKRDEARKSRMQKKVIDAVIPEITVAMTGVAEKSTQEGMQTTGVAETIGNLTLGAVAKVMVIVGVEEIGRGPEREEAGAKTELVTGTGSAEA